MKTSIRLVALLAISLTLSGCTRYVWMKQSGDPASFPADNFTCKQTAMNNAPPVFETYDPYPYGHRPERIVTECRDRGHHEVCRTRVISHSYAPPPSTVDLNAYNRNDMYNACMSAKGWVLQPVEE